MPFRVSDYIKMSTRISICKRPSIPIALCHNFGYWNSSNKNGIDISDQIESYYRCLVIFLLFRAATKYTYMLIYSRCTYP